MQKEIFKLYPTQNVTAKASPPRAGFYSSPDQETIRNKMELAKFDVFCENWDKNNPRKKPTVDPHFKQPFKKIAEIDGLDLDYSLTDNRGANDDQEDVSDDLEFDISSAQIPRDKENSFP